MHGKSTRPIRDINELSKYGRKFIPYSTPKNNDYDYWKETYYSYLLSMFDIFKNEFKKDGIYDIVDWKSNKVFESFCVLIYNTS